MDGCRYFIIRVISVCVLPAVLFAGCATKPVPTPSLRLGEPGIIGGCADFFASLDKRIKASGVIDSGVFRVTGYPYLRVNRFLSSFTKEVDNRVAFTAWVDRLQAMDQEARKNEIANLPKSAVAALGSAVGREELNSRVAVCGDILKVVDFRNSTHRKGLKKFASVPDDYISLRRFLGIYPITGLFVSLGVSRWHDQAHKRFSLQPPDDWKTIRYVSAQKIDVSTVHQILGSTKRDALGIPIYTAEARDALFRLYAPVWEVQMQGDYDRIGKPIWNGDGVLDVDTREPLTYTLISFTRFGKEILTQLNYIIWFSSRPKTGALDIYGGLLDGLNYRVTLKNNGEPYLYETIHNCGCYYKAYPTNQLMVHEKIDYAEPPLILKAPDLDPSTHFLAVAMESRTHFVQHLYPLSRKLQHTTTAYSLADYNQLRSLPYSGGARRNMFGQDSIAPGSERLERFILWPTGVLSPGGMRQWGRHAVAFIGKRHFDDPFYMDRMYKRSDSK